MNVRIVSRDVPGRITLYWGVASVSADRGRLKLHPSVYMGEPGNWVGLDIKTEVAEILLDDEGGIE